MLLVDSMMALSGEPFFFCLNCTSSNVTVTGLPIGLSYSVESITDEEFPYQVRVEGKPLEIGRFLVAFNMQDTGETALITLYVRK